MSSNIVIGEDGIKHNFLILEEREFSRKEGLVKVISQQFNLLHARSISFFSFVCFY